MAGFQHGERELAYTGARPAPCIDSKDQRRSKEPKIMKNKTAFLLVPALGVFMASFTWGQSAPSSATPGTPGATTSSPSTPGVVPPSSSSTPSTTPGSSVPGTPGVTTPSETTPG